MTAKPYFTALGFSIDKLLLWGVFVLLPYPIFGQTVGTLVIAEDTVLTENHEGTIIIDLDDVTLDCDGFTVSGTTADPGIELTDRTGVTVKNCTVIGSGSSGFDLDNSDGNRFTENIAVNNVRGFDSSDSHGNTFTENSAEGNVRQGFRFNNSHNNAFTENSAEGNFSHGFRFSNSAGNTFTENSASGNVSHGFRVSNTSSLNTFIENTANSNGGNGFRVLGASSLNTFRENEGFGNSIFDAVDASTGNEWVNNNFGITSGF